MFLTHYSALRVSVWKGDASMGTGSPEPIGMMVHAAASPAEIPVPSGGFFSVDDELGSHQTSVKVLVKTD